MNIQSIILGTASVASFGTVSFYFLTSVWSKLAPIVEVLQVVGK